MGGAQLLADIAQFCKLIGAEQDENIGKLLLNIKTSY
jgi:hypothetical protein